MNSSLFINENEYHTPANKKRAFLDHLALGSSLYFGPKFLVQLFGNRSLSLAGKFDTHMWAKRSMEIFHHIEDCGGKFHVTGLENIDAHNGPVVFVSNHMSMLETMVFPGIIASRREVTFVVKKSLTSHWLFGPVMRARNPIAVDRKDPISDFKTVMEQGSAHLANGTSVVIFPQSKRMVDFDPKQFNTLGIKLAKKNKVPVVPVAIKTDFWKNGKILKDVAGLDREKEIHISFGKPFEINGPGKEEHQQVIDFIQGHLSKW